MIPSLGNALLHAALILSILVIWCSLFRHNPSLLRALWAFILASIFLALLCLIYSYIVSDFTVLNVVNNSHTSKPLIYKVAAAWGNHEGSMLLWIGAIAVFSLAFACCHNVEDTLVRGTLISQATLVCFFLLFSILTSNPFQRLFPPPLDGYGLNPVLQDIGLAMHPPVLYLGYVGFSLTYSAAITGLILNRIDSTWAQILRPWVLASWTLLTAGIGLGSWWAYRELGWGGFWFWDPVENASLMPWLVGTALIHALFECARYGNFRSWATLLSLLTFILSMVGTFIVRSGLITSVHSFVLDPKRGNWILALMSLCTIIALACYLWRAAALSMHALQAQKTNWWREVLIWMNNLLLLVLVFMVIIGTLYPSILELVAGRQLSVGAPYYNTLGGILVLPLVACCALGSVEANLAPKAVLRKAWLTHRYTIWLAALVTIMLAWHLQMGKGVALALSFVSIWLMMVVLRGWVAHRPHLSNHIYSMMFAHLGVALVLLSIAINAGVSQSGEKVIKLGERVSFRGFSLTLSDLYVMRASNYLAKAGELTVEGNGINKTKLYPELRIYPVERQQTAEAAIFHHPFYDLYVALLDLDQTGTAVVRMHYKPMMGWLWLGCLLIVIGGAYGIALRVVNKGRRKGA